MQSADLPKQPMVLGRQQLQPFIAALIREKKQICKEFSVSEAELPFASPRASTESAYTIALRYQGFSLPNGQTLLAFDSLGITGAVLFDSHTQDLVAVLPWSSILKQKHPGEETLFDRTFFRLDQPPSGKWQLTALVFAIFGDKHDPRYETWEFHHGSDSSGYSTRYIMQPFRPEKD
jgi:hypothetical protein